MYLKIVFYILASIGIFLFMVMYPAIGLVYLIKFNNEKCPYIWDYNLVSFICYFTHFVVFRILNYYIINKTIVSYFLFLMNMCLAIWGSIELSNESYREITSPNLWNYGLANCILQSLMAAVFGSISVYNTLFSCYYDNTCIEARLKNDYESQTSYSSFEDNII